MIEEQLTHRIIGAFYRVFDTLGHGFVESVYRRALLHELGKQHLAAESEYPIDVWYDEICVGQFRADLVIERKVIAELKASASAADADSKQLLNYLRATDMEVGLLLHFGPRAAFKRFYSSNARKPALKTRT